MCLYPKLIKNKKYTMNKKNNGIIPEVKDERALYVPVGCGKCIECMKQKKRNWQVRMLEELKVNKYMMFVTLTFNEKALNELSNEVEIKSMNKDLDNELATLAVRRWLERIRKKTGKSVKHWLVTELGHEGTERIHLHGIIMCNDVELLNKWNYGNYWIGEYVNEKTINYIVKYINKIDTDHKGYTPKVLCSKGIGKSYLKSYNALQNKYNEDETKEYYVMKDGSKINLPKYYRNKMYNEEQKEKLWMNMLDKETRYVLGQEIKVKDSDNEYYAALEDAREKNKRLGYGDDSKEWSREEYQKKREKFRAIQRFNMKKHDKSK